MARIRTIKPEFWADEKIGSIPRDARLLFIGMWNFSDDFGVIRGNPRLLKAQIFAYDDDLRVGTISTLIDALVNARMLIPFTVRGESYLYIRTFNDHQIVEKPSQKTRLVSAEDLSEGISRKENQTLGEPSVSPPLVLGEPSVMEGKGIGREKEKEKEEAPKKNSAKVIEEIPIPENLKTPEFEVTWESWKKFRKEIKKPITETAAKEQLSTLSKIGSEAAIKTIKKSISNSWQGLFPESGQQNPKPEKFNALSALREKVNGN